jgi:hypothetical protein
MTSFTNMILMPLLSQDEATIRSLEYSLPVEPWQWMTAIIGGLIGLAWVIWLYRQDTRELSLPWKIWLVTLRLSAIAILMVIAINPQQRTQKMSYRPSRLAILVDTSSSMQNPVADESGTDEIPSRVDAVRTALADPQLLSNLQKVHEISIYTFDDRLRGPHVILHSQDPKAVALRQSTTKSPSTPEAPTAPKDETKNDAKGPVTVNSATDLANVNWEEILAPSGGETRLGDAMQELLAKVSGKTLSGVVVMSDGVSNAGVDPEGLLARLQQSRVKMTTVGVGGTKLPVNVSVANVLAPTDVQLKDPYEITAYVQGQGLTGEPVFVELLASTNGSPPSTVASQQVTLNESEQGAEVKFPQQPEQAGETQFTIRAKPVREVKEVRDSDNSKLVTVTARDKPVKVLLVSGGPSWDYRFLGGMLYRHDTIDIDVWLQSGQVGISQESDNLLFDFPVDPAKLFSYDVMVCFDADWTLIPPKAQESIARWVFTQGGGLIFVAGDVNTPTVAMDQSKYSDLLKLLPVGLETLLYKFQPDNETAQPWPVELTQEGQGVDVLSLNDDPRESARLWKEFAGLFRSYPTTGPKGSATVYAYLADPRSISPSGLPILFASQFYGQGRTFYIGSPEMYRLRSRDPEHFDRLWIKLIRMVGQGRLQRGSQHGMLLLESHQYPLGKNATIRARLFDPQYNPLTQEQVVLEVTDPKGQIVSPPTILRADPAAPGEYVGSLRMTQPGRYKLSLPVPNLDERVEDSVEVSIPQLEDKEMRQNVRLLKELGKESGGQYLTLDALNTLPASLPNLGEEFLIAERLQTLWDQAWVMYLLAGLLSLEWLSRKLLKLA